MDVLTHTKSIRYIIQRLLDNLEQSSKVTLDSDTDVFGLIREQIWNRASIQVYVGQLKELEALTDAASLRALLALAQQSVGEAQKELTPYLEVIEAKVLRADPAALVSAAVVVTRCQATIRSWGLLVSLLNMGSMRQLSSG